MFHSSFFCTSSSAPSLPAIIFEPSFSSSSSSSTSVPALATSNSALVKMERMMEEPLTHNLGKESCLSQLQQQRNEPTLSEDGGGSTERWGFSDEWFSVDDLLNLGDDVENDKEAEARDPYDEECIERGDSVSNSASSGLSCQPPSPPPPPETSLSDINVPVHDAEELEWVSFIIDDSHSVFTHDSSAGKFPQPPAPYVLKQTVNLAAVTADSGRPVEALGPVKAKRSKRARSSVLSTAWLMSCSFLLASSVSSTTNTTSCSSCNTSDSCLIYDPGPAAGNHESLLLYDVPPELPRPTLKQSPNKRGRKPKHPAADASERRCSHCGAQKTPQWRAGPLGAKTLCNACGVRFKSGRLLPEYRPACSPTFINHVHSNSHRKVLMMRRKKEAEVVIPASMTLIGS